MSLAETETVLSLWRGAVTVRRGPTMASIAAEVAIKHGLTVADLQSRRLGFRFAHPRQEAMALMRLAGKSTTQIGRFLGGRDHTTVLHGCRAHRARSLNVPVGENAKLIGRADQFIVESAS